MIVSDVLCGLCCLMYRSHCGRRRPTLAAVGTLLYGVINDDDRNFFGSLYATISHSSSCLALIWTASMQTATFCMETGISGRPSIRLYDNDKISLYTVHYMLLLLRGISRPFEVQCRAEPGSFHNCCCAVCRRCLPVASRGRLSSRNRRIAVRPSVEGRALPRLGGPVASSTRPIFIFRFGLRSIGRRPRLAKVKSREDGPRTTVESTPGSIEQMSSR